MVSCGRTSSPIYKNQLQSPDKPALIISDNGANQGNKNCLVSNSKGETIIEECNSQKPIESENGPEGNKPNQPINPTNPIPAPVELSKLYLPTTIVFNEQLLEESHLTDVETDAIECGLGFDFLTWHKISFANGLTVGDNNLSTPVKVYFSGSDISSTSNQKTKCFINANLKKVIQEDKSILVEVFSEQQNQTVTNLAKFIVVEEKLSANFPSIQYIDQEVTLLNGEMKFNLLNQQLSEASHVVTKMDVVKTYTDDESLATGIFPDFIELLSLESSQQLAQKNLIENHPFCPASIELDQSVIVSMFQNKKNSKVFLEVKTFDYSQACFMEFKVNDKNNLDLKNVMSLELVGKNGTQLTLFQDYDDENKFTIERGIFSVIKNNSQVQPNYSWIVSTKKDQAQSQHMDNHNLITTFTIYPFYPQATVDTDIESISLSFRTETKSLFHSDITGTKLVKYFNGSTAIETVVVQGIFMYVDHYFIDINYNLKMTLNSNQFQLNYVASHDLHGDFNLDFNQLFTGNVPESYGIIFKREPVVVNQNHFPLFLDFKYQVNTNI